MDEYWLGRFYKDLCLSGLDISFEDFKVIYKNYEELD
jgi:hypothetical protein